MIASMNTTRPERKQETQPGNERRTEPPWNVVLHNQWKNSLRQVVLVLRKIIPEMTLKRAKKTAWKAQCKGRAVVEQCRNRLAQLYQNLLQGEGLILSSKPAR